MSKRARVDQSTVTHHGPGARLTRIEKDDYYMRVAKLSAMRSKDPHKQVGAVIINKEKRIVGIGYNGMPNGCTDLPWLKGDEPSLETKDYYICHAELNAIVNSYTNNLKGCTIYQTLFPCNECAKLLIQNGIERVVYESDEKKEKDKYKASKKMLKMANVKWISFRALKMAIKK